MKNYGRKIIDYIFGKRSDCTPIHYECEQKVQADSDRSDIRVFETGLSSQRHGDYWQGTRNAEEEECNRLIEIAKKQGLYIEKTDWDKFGNRRMPPTSESVVYLYEHLIHNILFPDTRYRFIGISEDQKGIRIVLQQKNVSCMFGVPTQEMIDDYLIRQLGLTKEDKYFYGNEYFAITDVSNVSDNVLCDEDGRLYFIDPIVRLKRSGREVWEYLYKTRCL